MSDFIPANLRVGDLFRVKSAFSTSGGWVKAGIVVRVHAIEERVDDRIYDLTIHLLEIDPPGGSILWGRSHPLDQKALQEFLEPVSP